MRFNCQALICLFAFSVFLSTISTSITSAQTVSNSMDGSTKDIIDFERPNEAVQLVSENGSLFVPESHVECKWTFTNGVLTASPKWDSVSTPEAYQDFRMHLEFNVNDAGDVPRERNGNSGVYIQQRYELQILNSFGVSNADYKFDDCGCIYGLKKPDVLVSKPAGEWQSFDIVFRAARFKDSTKSQNARITVYQNGELIHDDVELKRKTGAGKPEENSARPIKLQGHHNQVAYRNVWIQKLQLNNRQEDSKPIPQITDSQKALPIRGECFKLNSSDAFVILPKGWQNKKNIPWVWYAPTLNGLPADAEKWMFETFLNAGVGIAGIDVGESYGSPTGSAKYSEFYQYLTESRKFNSKPCLLARSRGGLMLYRWAANNPQSVAGIAGIYPVCNIASYPGIEKACGAFGLTAEQLKQDLAKYNPVNRLSELANAKVPIFHIHGDSDKIVPLEDNSAIVAETYKNMGGEMTLEVVKGQGHNMWTGWFESENLVNFVLSCLGQTATSEETFQRNLDDKRLPNIVFMISDELAYYELSHMGNKKIHTPNIDQMAREGIRFTQSLAAAPVCGPLRCCLMTGQHMGHASMRTNGGGTPIRGDEPTIASMLKTQGYATGGFGKWGIGGRGSEGVPEQHGFDQFFGFYDQVHAHSFYTPHLIRNSEEVPLPGNSGGREGETYSHYEIMKEGLHFIRENKDRPFFCYLPVTPPHGMYDIPADDPAFELYENDAWMHDPKVPQDAKNYAAMVSMIDNDLKRVLDLLKELDLDKNTIVFFTGDNGGQDRFVDDQHPRGFFGPNVNPITGTDFRGQKRSLYEGALRIPFLVRWPGKIKPDQVSDHLFYQVDMMATLAELTGVTVPVRTDGISILPTLLGEDQVGHAQQQHEYLYWEYLDQVAVRKGNWKAVRSNPDSNWELYDLESDISEANDVAANHPELITELDNFAKRSHVPANPGKFLRDDLQKRDRIAKWKKTEPADSKSK